MPPTAATVGPNDVIDCAKREHLRNPSLLMRARAQATVQYGRSDRSSKLIRGFGSEAAAGFRSQRGRCLNRRPSSLAMLLSRHTRWRGRPSRPNSISCPASAGTSAARRSRPASARGVFGNPALPQSRVALRAPAPARKRFDALPDHVARAAMISHIFRAKIHSVRNKPKIILADDLPVGDARPRCFLR